jgi:hypothetical protein
MTVLEMNAHLLSALVANGIDAYSPGEETIIVEVDAARSIVVNVHDDGNLWVAVVMYDEDGVPYDDEELAEQGSVTYEDVRAIVGIVQMTLAF